MQGRWPVGVVGAVLLGVGPVGFSAPALGGPVETREVVVSPREPRPDVFFLAGLVRPDYARGPAILQRRNCVGCAWFGFERFRTDARSRFKRSVPDLESGRTRVCYRVKVPGGRGFAPAYSETNCLGPLP